MQKKNLHIIALPILIALFSISYYGFSNYRPKVLRQLADVKGVSTIEDKVYEIPIPDESEKVTSNKSSDGEILSYKSKKTKEQVQEFYRNVFSGKSWSIASKGVYEDFISIKYKNGNRIVAVTSYKTDLPFNSFVSIEAVN